MKNVQRPVLCTFFIGAGKGSRTPVTTLEKSGNTVIRYPQRTKFQKIFTLLKRKIIE